MVQSPTTSAVLKALECAWTAIQREHPEVPDVVLVVGRNAKLNGQYMHHGWHAKAAESAIPEVLITGERLGEGAELVLQTMLHEAAHSLNATRGIQDTSNNGSRHNRKFVAAASELGLYWPDDAEPSNTHGYSAVKLSDTAKTKFAKVIEDLDAAITMHVKRGILGGLTGPKAKSRNNVKTECDCGRILRMSRKVLEEGSVVCGLCDAPFSEVL